MPADPAERRAVLTSDTTAAIERVQVDRWRAMSSVEKARLVSDSTRATLALAAAGIRQRYPGASERECFLRLVARTLGPDLARRVYPEAERLADLR